MPSDFYIILYILYKITQATRFNQEEYHKIASRWKLFSERQKNIPRIVQYASARQTDNFARMMILSELSLLPASIKVTVGSIHHYKLTQMALVSNL
jgi:hypothetical protein